MIEDLTKAGLKIKKIESAKLHSQKYPDNFFAIVIKNKYEDIISYNVDDFEILDYEFHPLIKMEMIA